MLGHSATLSHTLSQTHPLIDEALLSPPARPPVDILSINLSSRSAFSVNLSTPHCIHKPPSPISHQSRKALKPLPPQTLYTLPSNLLAIEPPPSFSLVIEQGPSALPRALQSSVSPFSRGLRGLCPCTGSLLYNDSPLY